jgi:hypothetical protein
MLSAKWMIPIAFVSTSLFAQTANDLNGLMSAASHYVSSGMAGARDPEPLNLNKVIGNYSSAMPNVLMTKATDVQHWIFQYKFSPTKTGQDDSLDPEAKPTPHAAVEAQCTQGIFNNFRYLSNAITGTKSLEYTWVAVSLDNAIASLNANGYLQGFTSVELVRPDLPNWPDDFVYVFNCPMERREVGISCQTGALAWSYGY